MQTETDQVIPFSKLRARIAERLCYSKSHIPHFYVTLDVDMDSALKFRAAYNERSETPVSVNDLIVKATATALAEFTRLNAHVEPDKLVVKSDINIGIAVTVDDGIFVPVIPDCAGKTLAEIAALARKKTGAAKRGVLDTRAAGTFTISNLGMFGIKSFTAIINPPECAILAIGGIAKQPVFVEEKQEFAVRPIMNLCLGCDHRAVDGVYAAQFLNRLKAVLEQPEVMDRKGNS